MSLELFINILLSITVTATPLIFAAIGELVVEKAGVLNLGVEGMMIMGAVSGFVVEHHFGISFLSFFTAICVGMLVASIFGVLTQFLRANQVASGLALTLFGLGAAALWGQKYTGFTVNKIQNLDIPLLGDIPLIGKLIFGYDLLVYIAIFMVVATGWFLTKTRQGLILRAIGDNHDAAHALGHKVVLYRFMAILFGGAMAGIGGAYLSLVQTPLWVENMTAGRGWIALALVVFASWLPMRVIWGALIFGTFIVFQLQSQGFGIKIYPQYLAMLPYIMTIVVLVVISYRAIKGKGAKIAVPRCLGKAFNPSS
ncbi:MAG: ABC transporter permease [Alphaproteobacteria bacterium]|nr:ABC transporter permease [Alphaproteobacteria bacterium]